MRFMVKQKNAEYRSFLFRFFDPPQMALVVASIRDSFLSQCKISGQNLVVGLEDHAKDSTKLSKTSWIDNLSSEDLLIFLDYRCRVLQQMYGHYKKYRDINKHNIRYICENTLVNKLAKHNDRRLTCGGRPEKEDGELSLKELEEVQGLDIYSLQRQAINQTVDNMMERCVYVKKLPLIEVYQFARELSTYNVDPKGHIEGCYYNVDKSEFLEQILFEPKPKHCGFNIQGSPIYNCGDEYYSSAGDRVQCEEVVFKSMDDEYTF
jgi:hypothetical protein